MLPETVPEAYNAFEEEEEDGSKVPENSPKLRIPLLQNQSLNFLYYTDYRITTAFCVREHTYTLLARAWYVFRSFGTAFRSFEAPPVSFSRVYRSSVSGDRPLLEAVGESALHLHAGCGETCALRKAPSARKSLRQIMHLSFARLPLYLCFHLPGFSLYMDDESLN